MHLCRSRAIFCEFPPVRRVATALLISAILPLLAQAQIGGRNINMVSGIAFPGGDPFLQRQNEPSLAVSTRNPMHLLAGSNDYRTVDLPGLPSGETGDAWLGLFKSFDGGQTWTSTLVPGYPQDTSLAGTTSPMKAYQAGADPVVRAGTNGLFYFAGLAFSRAANSPSAITVSRFLDNNNNEAADPIQFLGTSVVAVGTTPVFVDKPWIAVDIPRPGAGTCSIGNPVQSIPAGTVYAVYTAFVSDELHGRIMFSMSKDCGATWSPAAQIADSNSTNQGATIAVDPVTGSLYVAWRRFNGTSGPDAIMFSKSVDFGLNFSAPAVASPIIPFDQATSLVSFRTNAYPTLAVDGSSRIYLAWSQRGVGTGGDARVVVSTSLGGTVWSAPVPVDNVAARGHQIMPALSFAGGKLALVYYDLREDTTDGIFTPLGGGAFNETRVPIGDLASVPPHPEKVFTTGVVDASPDPLLGALRRRHTMDVRFAMADAGVGFQFASTKVSQYPIGSRPGSAVVEQMQMNPPNLPMFASGTVPFIGDYVDLAALAFVRDANGNWIYNTAPSNATIFHTVWTDNRDVRPPSDGNWANYTPPTSTATQFNSVFDPTKRQPACVIGQSGSRNQNIYTAQITQGLIAQSPGNSKPLSATIPRGFVVKIQNTSAVSKTFRAVIANQPPGGRASFTQVRSSSSFALRLDLTIPARSVSSRTVFVLSTLAQAQVRVDISEVTGPNGTVVPGGLQTSVLLNPDPTNPANSAISGSEIYNPDISNPDISNPDISNPDISNPDISNPDISNPDISNVRVSNPDISNPDISNPDISNPDISNPDISNPDISNPDISNGAISDVTWIVRNRGNTSSSYAVRTLLAKNFPAGFKEQLVIHKVYSTPVSSACTLALQTTTELLTNIIHPVFSTSSDVSNPDISNATIPTLALAPNETAKITLRVVNPNRTTNTDFDPKTAVIATTTAQGADTTDFLAGNTQPPVAASQLLILTTTLPNALAGAAYTPVTLLSAGGTAPIAWSLFSGAPPNGMGVSPTGVLSGTPTASGTFTFTVQATDSSPTPQIFRQALTLIVTAPPPLAITSPSVPNGYVGLNYAYALAASGGIAPRTWVITAGTLPPGVNLSAAGGLTGSPLNYGAYLFTVRVTDSSQPPLTATRSFTAQVVPLTLSFVVAPASTQSGLSIPVQVKVQDSFGNAVPGMPVTLSFASGGPPVWDAVLNYSNAANPNGPWVYGQASDPLDTGFQAFTSAVAGCTNPAGGECWTNGLAFPDTASVIHNKLPSALFYGGTILQPPNVLNLAVANSAPAVRWVAPASDTYRISGQFTRIDVSPHPTDVSIVRNNSTVLFSSPNFNDTFNPVPFALSNLSLIAGSTVDFLAAPSLDASDGSTGLAVTITGSGPVLNGNTTVTTGANGIAVFSVSIASTGTYTLKATQPVSTTVTSGGFTITP